MSNTPSAKLQFSNKLYDLLKSFATLGLPAVATLYFTLAQLWGFPNPEQVVGTITAVNVFLGLLLRISSKSFEANEDAYAGSIDIEKTENGSVYSLVLNGSPEELDGQSTVKFKINSL